MTAKNTKKADKVIVRKADKVDNAINEVVAETAVAETVAAAKVNILAVDIQSKRKAPESVETFDMVGITGGELSQDEAIKAYKAKFESSNSGLVALLSAIPLKKASVLSFLVTVYYDGKSEELSRAKSRFSGFCQHVNGSTQPIKGYNLKLDENGFYSCEFVG